MTAPKPRGVQTTCDQSPATVAKRRFPRPAKVICQAVAPADPPAFQCLESTDPKAQLKDPPSRLRANQVSFFPIAPVAVRLGHNRTIRPTMPRAKPKKSRLER